MARVDNFRQMSALFDNVKEGYYLPGCIIVRGKDFEDYNRYGNMSFHEIRNDHKDIKYYVFDNFEDLAAASLQIKLMCKGLNARFYLYTRPVKYDDLNIHLANRLMDDVNDARAGIYRPSVLYDFNFVIGEYAESTYPENIMIDLDDPSYTEELRELLLEVDPDCIIMDFDTVTGHNFLVKDIDVSLIRRTDELENLFLAGKIEFKPNSPLLVYYDGEGYPFID